MAISERIKSILLDKNLTASAMAELMDVQASTLSHILSGRNNPSLEILIKIKKAFPDLDWDWLLLGEKSKNHKTDSPTLFSDRDENLQSHSSDQNVEEYSTPDDSEVEKVILLMKNGKFREYNK